MGWLGEAEMAILPYFIHWKCPYVRGWVVQKRPKTRLSNVKMYNINWSNLLKHTKLHITKYQHKMIQFKRNNFIFALSYVSA